LAQFSLQSATNLPFVICDLVGMANWQALFSFVGGEGLNLSVAEKLFTDARVSKPDGCDGLQEEDFVFGDVEDLPVKAFLRRSFRAALESVDATQSAAAPPPQAAAFTSISAAPVAVQSMMEVLGTNASVAAVVRLMTYGDKEVDVNAKLAEVVLE